MVLASSLPQIREHKFKDNKFKVVQKKHSAVVEAKATANVSSKPASKSVLARLAPILASALCVAAIMYPLDLVRALQMANAGSGSKLTTMQLLTNFKNAHGIQGFFTQGLAPELARSTWMRFVKFSLFPIVHLFVTNGIEESKGNSASKALAAMIGSIPEALSIMVRRIYPNYYTYILALRNMD